MKSKLPHIKGVKYDTSSPVPPTLRLRANSSAWCRERGLVFALLSLKDGGTMGGKQDSRTVDGETGGPGPAELDHIPRRVVNFYPRGGGGGFRSRRPEDGLGGVLDAGEPE